MKNTFIVIALLALTPFVTFGAQQMLTEQGVKSSYKEQVKLIDTQIQELKDSEGIVDKKNYMGEFKQSYYDYLVIQSKIEKLNDDRRILDISYKLVINSFQ